MFTLYVTSTDRNVFVLITKVPLMGSITGSTTKSFHWVNFRLANFVVQSYILIIKVSLFLFPKTMIFDIFVLLTQLFVILLYYLGRCSLSHYKCSFLGVLLL